MTRLRSGLLAGMMLLAAMPVEAQYPDLNGYHRHKRAHVKFDPQTGCWDDRSIADSYLMALDEPDTYLFITMTDPNAKPDGPPMGGRRLKLTDVFDMIPPLPMERDETARNSVIIHVPEAGNYELAFGPNSLRGHMMETTICRRRTRDG